MPDYEAMYKKLFNSVTDVIITLQKAQELTEDIFIDEINFQIDTPNAEKES